MKTMFEERKEWMNEWRGSEEIRMKQWNQGTHTVKKKWMKGRLGRR